MRLYLFALAVAAMLIAGFSTQAQATITGGTCANAGDGAIDCTGSWDPNTGEMTINGNQFWSPGHMLGEFTTDTEEDPTVTMITLVDNDTAFTWDEYFVNIYMDKKFTLANALVLSPSGWSTSVSQPAGTPGTFYDADSREWDYKGILHFTAGTPVVNNGSSLDFSYQMIFTGGVQFEEEMVPLPEPATLTLLALGALALVRRRR
jgi:hypothetical protein